MDSDEILICEVYKVAKNMSELFSEHLATPKADKVLDTMVCDGNGNIQVVLFANSEPHTVTTNCKTTRHHSFDKVKDELKRIRGEIITCMSDNITDQNSEVGLTSLMACFDLDSTK